MTEYTTPDRCPKCGAGKIYVGMDRIECGLNPECDNYTEEQSNNIVNMLKAETYSNQNAANSNHENDTAEEMNEQLSFLKSNDHDQDEEDDNLYQVMLDAWACGDDSS